MFRDLPKAIRQRLDILPSYLYMIALKGAIKIYMKKHKWYNAQVQVIH